MKKFKIQSFNQQEIEITLAPTSIKSKIDIIDEAEAVDINEATIQIDEEGVYEFLIEEGFILEEIPGIVSISQLNKNSGRITPNIYVGTLLINILESKTYKKIGFIPIEVRSVKTSYREDYRLMLEEIAENCTDLIMQHTSPVSQSFIPDLEKDAESAYQRFAFISSIIDSTEFESAVFKITSAPTTKWENILTDKPIQSIRRIDRKLLRQFSTSNRRVNIPSEFPLSKIFSSLPEKVQMSSKEETVDTHENRFIKFALENFYNLSIEFSNLKNNPRLKKEASLLSAKIERYLNNNLFKNVGALHSVSTNNPVLQRKEGYREIYKTWILFDLAAKLTWKGGDDVFKGNKRDVATLYEYWLYFKLLDTIKDVFKIEPKNINDLIKETKDGLGLQLLQGKHFPIKGTYIGETRKLEVEFSYNKTFDAKKSHPEGGSWTRSMRPDYTLSLWPYGVDEITAEREELIVHVHFDAKYKIEKLTEILGDEFDLITEKEEQNKGTYKRADLLKMHTYKDAIRRTAGAYILYPGTEPAYKKIGFHEIIPGLGAFAIRPSKRESGINELKLFLHEIVEHFLNRASQREKISFHTYNSYKENDQNKIIEDLPEAIKENRNFLPDETYVLVGFYKNEAHLRWILKNNMYNARTGSSRGSLRLSPKETQARYLLLHTTGETKTKKMFKLENKGPRIFSKENMIKKLYPNPSQEFYLVYDIIDNLEKEFINKEWDVNKLNGFTTGRASGIPFAVSLSELFKKD